VTIDRGGRVRHVIVGDADQLFLPDLGRSRAGSGRFRGVRLVHTHLRDEPLTHDDLTDLGRLRLDLICAIGVDQGGRPSKLYYSHLMPHGSDAPHAEQVVTDVHALDLDFTAFIEALEDEFGRATVGATETEGQTRAIAAHVTTGSSQGGASPEESMRELVELADTAEVVVVDTVTQRRKRFDPRFVMGKGKLDELLLLTMQLDCELVIFDQDLSPNQARAIADVTDVKVIDRTQLILDIFARRAHTAEGKLQVELAQLKYMLPRLAQRTTAYSRLMGGIGGRGPGETKLEIDRRRARDRIRHLEKRLQTVAKQRETRRHRRNSRDVPVISIVGYTNAGKSTLLNTLTQSAVLAEDKLFATLDTTSRRLRFPEDREVIITDTVGFIRDLPKDLMAAFRATLEELHDADLLVHVVDVSDPNMEHQIQSVERILDDLDLLEKPRMKVFNKIDRVEAELAQNLCDQYGAIGLSALDRSTTRPLVQAVESHLWLQDQPPLQAGSESVGSVGSSGSSM
jgi:GTP-binding protein HflX